jgi:hypothetical protein
LERNWDNNGQGIDIFYGGESCNLLIHVLHVDSTLPLLRNTEKNENNLDILITDKGARRRIKRRIGKDALWIHQSKNVYRHAVLIAQSSRCFADKSND